MKEQKNRLGFLGGLFDPIHNGHLSLCRQIQSQLKLDKILFIPAYMPPHKHRYSDYEHRCRMTTLAISDISGFELSRLESEIRGLSYTVHTLEKLHESYPAHEIYFMIGSDNLHKMEDWYHPEDIFRMCTVVMGNRPGLEGEQGGKFADKLMRLDIEPLDISSTEIRQFVREGKPIEQFVPPAVAEYIKKEGLYV